MRKFAFFSILSFVIPVCAINIGYDAPNFTLKDQEGFSHNLYAHRGKFVVLLFIPKSYFISCVYKLEKIEEFTAKIMHGKTIVYAITTDAINSNCKLYDKAQISFDILSDLDKSVVSSYDCTSLMGMQEKVVLIGPDGRVFKNYKSIVKFLDSKRIINFIINCGS